MPFSLKMKVEFHVPPDHLYDTNVNSIASLFITTKKVETTPMSIN